MKKNAQNLAGAAKMLKTQLTVIKNVEELQECKELLEQIFGYEQEYRLQPLTV